MNKEQWLEKFNSVYKDCSLHSLSIYSRKGTVIANVFYKNNNGQRRIDVYNNYDKNVVLDHEDEGGNIERQNTKETISLFGDVQETTDFTGWFTYIQRW